MREVTEKESPLLLEKVPVFQERVSILHGA
jgi:hypothetical protein